MGSNGAREADQNNVRFSGEWDCFRELADRMRVVGLAL